MRMRSTMARRAAVRLAQAFHVSDHANNLQHPDNVTARIQQVAVTGFYGRSPQFSKP
jgi:hypothetical protein